MRGNITTNTHWKEEISTFCPGGTKDGTANEGVVVDAKGGAVVPAAGVEESKGELEPAAGIPAPAPKMGGGIVEV
jgi:hypothetical protein